MATKFITPSWRMPKNSNQSKASNYSIDFDGTSQYIDLNPGYTFSGSFGISAWFKNDILGNKGMLLGQGVNDNNSFIWAYNTTRFYIPFSGSTATFNNDGNNPIPTSGNGWAHVAMWRDDSNTVHCYLNGQDFGTLNKVNTTQTNPFTFDRIGAAATSFWDGDIGQLSAFDYALTTESVSALYNGGIPSNPLAVTTPPIAYYNLGQGSAYASGSAGIVEPNLAAATGSTVFEFDTSDIEFNNVINLGTTWTISFWIKTTSSLLSNQTILAAGSGNGFTMLLLRNNRLMLYRGAGADYNYFLANGQFNDGEWHNITLVRNGTKDIIPYLDGNIGSYYFAAGSGNLDTNMKFIGDDGGTWGTATPFNGELSNIQFWNTNLETEDLTTLYNNGTPLQSNIPQSGSLKAWYKLGLDTSNWGGTDWVIGEAQANYSSALDFNGSGYIAISPNTFDATNGLTMSCWVRYDRSTVTGTNWLCSSGGTGGVNSQFNTRLQGGIYGGSWFNYFNGGSTYTGIGGLGDGQWHHIAQTINYSTGDVMFYKDGVPSSTVLTWGSAYAVATLSQISTSFFPFDGDISNFAIFSSALSTPNIVTLYNNGTPEVTPSFSPTSWWKLDNTTTGIQDSAGSNNGTNNGATITNIQVSTLNGISSGMDTTNLVPSNLIKSIPYSGYSMLFDAGDGDHITTNGPIITSGGLSFSCWFKTSDTTNNQVIWNGIDSTTAKSFVRITGTALRVKIIDGSGGNNNIDNTVTTADGKWHHIAFTSDGLTTTNGVIVYLDGAPLGTTGTLSNAGFASTTKNQIGSYAPNTWNFDGNLSNPAFFNRVLSQDEILRVYNGGSPGDLSNLGPTSWWSLGADSYFNGSDWICPDIGANTNNGTSQNMGAENLVGDGPDSLANGTSTNLDLASDLIGEAPGSTGNAISVNMNSLARTGSTP